MLIPLYFRAAASEARSYPRELRRTIMLERLATVAFQLSVAFALYSAGGWGVLAMRFMRAKMVVSPSCSNGVRLVSSS